MKIVKYKPEKCECCGQSTTYLLGLDRGSFTILRKLLDGVSQKGINQIHPTRDLTFTGREKWLVTNISRPRKHGLIAFIEEKKGYYCLTRKAGQFLRGKSIARYAIISKKEQRTLGYWEPDVFQVTAQELLKNDELPFWEGELIKASEMLDIIDPPGLSQARLDLP